MDLYIVTLEEKTSFCWKSVFYFFEFLYFVDVWTDIPNLTITKEGHVKAKYKAEDKSFISLEFDGENRKIKKITKFSEEIKEKLIDDLIDRWHESDSKELLHSYLKMSKKEYKKYLEENAIPKDWTWDE